MDNITYDQRSQQYIVTEDNGTTRPASEDEIVEYQRSLNNQGISSQPDWDGDKNPASGWLG